jgi:hypothetical protein
LYVSSLPSAGSPFLRFDFTLSRLIVLDCAEIFDSATDADGSKGVTRRILEHNGIEWDRSLDLREAKKQGKDEMGKDGAKVGESAKELTDTDSSGTK